MAAFRGIGTPAIVVATMLLGPLYAAQAEPAAKPAAKPANPPAKTADKTADKGGEAPTCDRAAFRVAVDVGHTEEVPGAKSARGNYEYDFNLRLAKLIDQKLRDAGFSKTMLLVTHGRTHAGLAERVERANSSGANLFFSIHHDSVPDKFLQKWTYEGEEHSYSDRFKGHSIFISNSNANPSASLVFGHLLGQQLKVRELRYTPHYTEKFMGSRQRILVDKEAGVYRYDQLIVLKDTNMPAVLLEAGSIINRDEEVALATSDRHERIAASAVDAVDAFCAIRQSPKPTQVAHQPAARSTAAKAGMQPASASASPFSFLSPKKR
jgi:N-acetylmuramoyl-L-alanine amidase